jgi:group I intron endonuclease
LNEYGIIYCALNIVNNKRYIRQTIRSLQRRKNEHIHQAKHGSEFTFHKAIRKYNEDKFEWSIIDVASNAKELDEKEAYWIKHYDTYHHGYNMSTGGQFNQRNEHNADDMSLRYGGRELSVFYLNGNYIKSAISQSQFSQDIGAGITTGIKNSTQGYILIFKDE